MRKIFLAAILSSFLLLSCGNYSNCTSKEEQIIYTSKKLYGTLKVVSQEEVYFNYENILFEYVKGKTSLVIPASSNILLDEFVFQDGHFATGTISFGITKWSDVSETSNKYLKEFNGSPFLSELFVSD